MSNASDLREWASLLTNWGWDVRFVPGWESRGRGVWNPKGWIWHHDASNSKYNNGALRIVTFGRSDLKNALSQTFTARDATVYVICANKAWHAGTGRLGSNYNLGGNEGANNGIGEPWSADHYNVQVDMAVAWCIVKGWSPESNWDHKEHTSRKIDRTGIDPDKFRSDVKVRLEQILSGENNKNKNKDEDYMIYFGDGPSLYVKNFQFLLNRFHTDTGGKPTCGWLIKDGNAGNKTFDSAWEAVLRLNDRRFTGDAAVEFYRNAITSRNVLIEEGIDPALIASIAGAAAKS